MKLATTILLFAAIATSAGLQEVKHAPTVDVCRADVALWWTDYIVQQYENSENELANGGEYVPNPAGDLPIKEASARMSEMRDCESVDKPNFQTYSSAFEFYFTVCMERYRQFIQRHGLLDKFMKEDAAGVR